MVENVLQRGNNIQHWAQSELPRASTGSKRSWSWNPPNGAGHQQQELHFPIQTKHNTNIMSLLTFSQAAFRVYLISVFKTHLMASDLSGSVITITKTTAYICLGIFLSPSATLWCLKRPRDWYGLGSPSAFTLKAAASHSVQSEFADGLISCKTFFLSQISFKFSFKN